MTGVALYLDVYSFELAGTGDAWAGTHPAHKLIWAEALNGSPLGGRASERATLGREETRRGISNVSSETFFFYHYYVFHFAPLNVLPLGDVAFLSLPRSLSLSLRYNAFKNAPHRCQAAALLRDV